MSRVYFADVYKEYEILHRYVSRLTEKYKEVLMAEKLMKPAISPENGDTEGSGESMEKEKKNIIKVRCKSVRLIFGDNNLISFFDVYGPVCMLFGV